MKTILIIINVIMNQGRYKYKIILIIFIYICDKIWNEFKLWLLLNILFDRVIDILLRTKCDIILYS